MNIRPAYQRDFIYKLDKQRAAIEAILNSIPLNIMSFVKITNNRYEVLGEQQRILSICYFMQISGFGITFNNATLTYHNLSTDIKKKMKTISW
ncbi:MAG: hypothetical protein Ta2E_03570 [Mycoplasmoidaceae bacterium]|nr:MAG: hypothetical protein Ta2E_03570 [Mycoplasmoidaceae bacterium]